MNAETTKIFRQLQEKAIQHKIKNKPLHEWKEAAAKSKVALDCDPFVNPAAAVAVSNDHISKQLKRIADFNEVNNELSETNNSISNKRMKKSDAAVMEQKTLMESLIKAQMETNELFETSNSISNKRIERSDTVAKEQKTLLEALIEGQKELNGHLKELNQRMKENTGAIRNRTEMRTSSDDQVEPKIEQ
ncbi:hypothetical protein FSARC_7875 [Fusarium sarcochroum]|uniref:Uncharacterized protein n=1 Tax=Fusarium sarcochroum TaxID=1208366 RepID=A0A8H4TUF8_9HYPO|nr:hypothetical protein FSARC_7875 [Fusarium sarcochroum]